MPYKKGGHFKPPSSLTKKYMYYRTSSYTCVHIHTTSVIPAYLAHCSKIHVAHRSLQHVFSSPGVPHLESVKSSPRCQPLSTKNVLEAVFRPYM